MLLILIDDAGFGQPDTFGGRIRTPNLTRVAEEGLTYNRFHVVALCSPTRAAMLTGRNQHRVGMGSVAEFPGPFPGYTGARAEELHGAAADPAGERLRHRRLRQVAHDAGPRAGRRRPVRPLAAGLGLRPLLGLPQRRGGPVRPADLAGQHEHRRAGGQGTTTSRTTSPTRPSSGCTRCGRRTPRSRGSSTTRPAARTRRTTSRRNGPTSTRASSTTGGTRTARRPSRGRRSSGSSRRTRS